MTKELLIIQSLYAKVSQLGWLLNIFKMLDQCLLFLMYLLRKTTISSI